DALVRHDVGVCRAELRQRAGLVTASIVDGDAAHTKVLASILLGEVGAAEPLPFDFGIGERLPDALDGNRVDALEYESSVCLTAFGHLSFPFSFVVFG